MEENQTPPQSTNPTANRTPYLVGAAVAVAAVGALVYKGAMKPTTPTPPSTETDAMAPAVKTETTPETAGSEAEVMVTDRTFTTTGKYVSPAGPESIAITITLDDNSLVTAAEMAPTTAENQFSKKWQETFRSNFAKEVIGKDITTLKLDKVAGSSLTPKGFNDAVDKIKAKLST